MGSRKGDFLKRGGRGFDVFELKIGMGRVCEFLSERGFKKTRKMKRS